MEMEVTFPGKMKVDAHFNGFTVKTDQPVDDGGDGTAPAPFAQFLASLATCAGIYVVFFCEKRQIPYDRIRLVQKLELDPQTEKIVRIKQDIRLPADFPEKYVDALVRSAGQCTVKKLILDPPEMTIGATIVR